MPCPVNRTGVCTIPRRTKRFCDDSFGAIEGENPAHQFLCQSEMLRNNGTMSLTCSNGVWTPTTTLCTRKYRHSDIRKNRGCVCKTVMSRGWNVCSCARKFTFTVTGIAYPNHSLFAGVCQPIVLPTANFTCLRNGKKVNCSQPLLTGTKIYPQCEFYYRPSQREIVCQANGKWSHNTIECIPGMYNTIYMVYLVTKKIQLIRSTVFRMRQAV